MFELKVTQENFFKESGGVKKSLGKCTCQQLIFALLG